MSEETKTKCANPNCRGGHDIVWGAPCGTCQPIPNPAHTPRSGELLPCPFCGSEGYLEELDRPGSETGEVTFQANCSNEACIAYQFLFSGFSRRTDAKKAWNTRTRPALSTDEQEAREAGESQAALNRRFIEEGGRKHEGGVCSNPDCKNPNNFAYKPLGSPCGFCSGREELAKLHTVDTVLAYCVNELCRIEMEDGIIISTIRHDRILAGLEKIDNLTAGFASEAQRGEAERPWILVSERLPDQDDLYEVTVESNALCVGEDDEPYFNVEDATYRHGKWSARNVVAWRKFRTPYIPVEAQKTEGA